jgi:hypothetical protein
MKRILLLTVVLLMLGSVGLYAQVQRNFQLNIIGGSGELSLEMYWTSMPFKTVEAWPQVSAPNSYYHSETFWQHRLITHVIVRASTPCKSTTFYEYRSNLGYNNVFNIDLSLPIQDPTPPITP